MVTPSPTRIRDRIAAIPTAKGRTAARAAEHALALADVVPGFTIRRDGLEIVFDAAPQFIRDKQGNVGGIDALVRVFEAGVELRVDPHRIAWNPPCLVPDGAYTVEVDPVTREVRDLTLYREDPREAYLSWLVDSLRDTPNPDGWRTKGTVTTVFTVTGTAGDGYVSSDTISPNPYSDAREGTGTASLTASTGPSSTNSIGQYMFFNDFHCFEFFMAFDTSGIPDTDTVSAVALKLRGAVDSSTTDFTINARTKDWGATLTTADWVAGSGLSALTLLATFATSGFSTTGYNTFTENGTNFQSAINKTGTTFVMCSSSRHQNGDTPTGDEYVNVATAEDGGAGTTNDPKIEVTHAGAGGGLSIPVAMAQYRQRWR